MQFLIHPQPARQNLQGRSACDAGFKQLFAAGAADAGRGQCAAQLGVPTASTRIGQMADYLPPMRRSRGMRDDCAARTAAKERQLADSPGPGRRPDYGRQLISDFPRALAAAGSRTKLWPTQRQAIAQALYLLGGRAGVPGGRPDGIRQNTRMGAHLLEALLKRLCSAAGSAVAVSDHLSAAVPDTPLGAGAQHARKPRLPTRFRTACSAGDYDAQSREATLEKIRRAHILVVDEAHNYLNKTSARSQSVVMNRPTT